MLPLSAALPPPEDLLQAAAKMIAEDKIETRCICVTLALWFVQVTSYADFEGSPDSVVKLRGSLGDATFVRLIELLQLTRFSSSPQE